MPLRFSPILAILLVCGDLLLPPVGNAQTIPSAYEFIDTRHEFGLFAGRLSMGRGQYGIGPGEGMLFGARYGLELSGPLSLEAVPSLFQATRNVIDPGTTGTPVSIGEADALLVGLDARLKFALNGRRSWHGFGPYLFAGGGITWDAAGEGGADVGLPAQDRFHMGASFLGVMGAGVRWFPSDGFQLRFDLESRFHRLKTPPGFSATTTGLQSVPESRWARGTGLSIGASILR